MKENPVARSIVANLAWRYRRARASANRERSREYSVQLRAIFIERESEARNAYMASLCILFGVDP